MDSAPPPAQLERRRFLTRISVALSAAVGAVMGLPVVGFLLAPLTRRAPRVWRPVGRVDEFKVGETVSVRFEDASPLPWAGVTARTAAWLRRDDESRFTAYSVHCTHLGCPVRWVSEARAVPLSLPWRRVLRRRNGLGGPAAQAAPHLPRAGARRSGRDPDQPDPDRLSPP